MKYTLLQLVQDILSEMDSDEVNSISDTTEAMQVARVVRTAYYDIVSKSSLPEHYEPFQLTASGDNTKPTLMTLPTDVRHIEWVKYNKAEDGDTDENFTLIQYLEPFEFTERMHFLSTDSSNVGTYTQDFGGTEMDIFYEDDRHPQYYTLYDDNTVIFDSYQAAVDTTLQSSKTFCFGEKGPEFTLGDNFIPDLDEKQFALLLNEALRRAFATLKQSPHPIATEQARSQWINLRKEKSVVPENHFKRLPYYGRK